ATVPAALQRFDAALLEAVPAGNARGALLDREVVAAVVDEAERIAIGHRRHGYEVAAAELEPVEAVAPRREVDQPLDDEHHLRPARGAVRRSRRGIRQHAASAGG